MWQTVTIHDYFPLMQNNDIPRFPPASCGNCSGCIRSKGNPTSVPPRGKLSRVTILKRLVVVVVGRSTLPFLRCIVLISCFHFSLFRSNPTSQKISLTKSRRFLNGTLHRTKSPKKKSLATPSRKSIAWTTKAKPGVPAWRTEDAPAAKTR